MPPSLSSVIDIKEAFCMNKYRLFAWMIILTHLAGFINAVSVFCYAGATVSHVTGLISKLAISVITVDIGEIIHLFLIIFAFFVGAVIAGIATGERAFYLRKIYGYIILAIGAIVIVPFFLESWVRVPLLAFLMGLQNGMVVSFRGILVRMTHMTGNLTDVGVYIGYKIRGNKEEKPVSGFVPAAAILGFFLGGLVGILLHKFIGSYVFIVASAVYLILGAIYFRLQKTCSDKDFNGVDDSMEMAESIAAELDV